LSEVLEQPPTYGTPEWYAKEEEEMEEAARREVEAKRLAREEEEWLFGVPVGW
jgi:hypothetical protein